MNIRSNDKIQKIFKATFELIAEHGIHNTPMSVIIKKSGVAAGTIYHYFESKEALMNDLYISLKEELIGEIMKDYNSQTSYKDRFFSIWTNYYNYLVDNPDILSFI
jgi:AcrR family transcriptional regulator